MLSIVMGEGVGTCDTVWLAPSGIVGVRDGGGHVHGCRSHGYVRWEYDAQADGDAQRSCGGQRRGISREYHHLEKPPSIISGGTKSVAGKHPELPETTLDYLENTHLPFLHYT